MSTEAMAFITVINLCYLNIRRDVITQGIGLAKNLYWCQTFMITQISGPCSNCDRTPDRTGSPYLVSCSCLFSRLTNDQLTINATDYHISVLIK
jgi:hypothetical protein